MSADELLPCGCLLLRDSAGVIVQWKGCPDCYAYVVGVAVRAAVVLGLVVEG